MGIATFKTKQDDVVMEKNIDDILASLEHRPESTPPQITNFDENDRIYIKFVMSEKRGWNYRNKVAHGLLDSDEYQIGNCILIFATLLRLTHYNFSSEEL